MHSRTHRLTGGPLLTTREIVSLHFGPADSGRKVYVQAALHADELPGALVAHALARQFEALEAEGRLRAEVVVVPLANPIGIAQSVLRRHQGRFDLASGENFNRHYPALFKDVLALIEGRLGDDEARNARIIREALVQAVHSMPVEGELAHQRRTLLGLACDAEVVIDLHCDCEALMHLYTGTALWPQAEPLARYTGAQVSLLASESGDNPFDEACSQTWWQLEEHFRGRFPIPLGCLSVTLELRGEADVSHRQARDDAAAIIAFLTHRGVVAGTAPPMPPLVHPPTPLAGTDVGRAPHSGIVVYHREPGDWIREGEVVADLVDPVSGSVQPLTSRTEGLLFARESQRYAPAGRSLFKVAGRTPIRSGKLSSE